MALDLRLCSFSKHVQHPINIEKTSFALFNSIGVVVGTKNYEPLVQDLLCNYAKNAALQGAKVIFVHRRELNDEIPFECQRNEEEALRRISLKYLDTDAALRQYLAYLPLIDEMPEVIIVNRLGSFFQRHGQYDRQKSMRDFYLETFAFMKETITILQKRSLKEGSKVPIFIVGCDQLERKSKFYHRWISLFLRINPVGVVGEQTQSPSEVDASDFEFNLMIKDDTPILIKGSYIT